MVTPIRGVRPTKPGSCTLPFFGDAKEHAYFTRLEPFPTMSPKSIWASVATGKLPFRAENAVTMINKILNEDPARKVALRHATSVPA